MSLGFRCRQLKMAISSSKTLSEKERKFQIIQTQLYGKKEHFTTVMPKQASSPNLSPQDVNSSSHLKKDLSKTVIFASLAIGIQILLYFSLKNNFLPTFW